MKIKIVFKDKSFIKGEVDDLNSLIVKSNSFTYLNINKQEILYIKVYNSLKEPEQKDYIENVISNKDHKEVFDPIHEDAKKEAKAALDKIEQVKLEIKDNLFSSVENPEEIIDPEANYGLPSFSALKISKQYSNQKIRNKNTRNKE